MLFDKFASFMEKNIPERVSEIESIRLFDFPYSPKDLFPLGENTITQDQVDTFFLPYPKVAIEDRDGLVVLFDTEDKQVGLAGWRKFIDVQKHTTGTRSLLPGMKPIEDYIAEGVVSLEDADAAGKLIEGKICLTFGMIRVVSIAPDGSGMTFDGDISRVVLIDQKGMVEVVLNQEDIKSRPGGRDATLGSMYNAKAAIEEVLFFNQPQRFILESTPSKQRTAKKGRITRSHDRPTYTLLTPGEIRKRLDLPEFNPETGMGTKKRPHERRRHFRTLNHPRFRNKQGETIIVEACWVGPTEKTIGKRTYKVCLDL